MLRSQSVYGRRAVVAARESYVCLLVHVTGSNAAGDRWQSLQKSRSSSKGCSRLVAVVQGGHRVRQLSTHSSRTPCETARLKPDGRQARVWPAVVAAKRY